MVGIYFGDWKVRWARSQLVLEDCVARGQKYGAGPS